MSDLIGRSLGPYQLIAQLGQGGMATVYKAYQPAMDRYVAIKVLPHHMAQDSNFRARFERETRTIAKLEHRYILPVHDSGEDDGIHYMVMRYTDSGTFSDLIASGTLSYERTTILVAQVAEALAYAHRQGIIHRDIKPANILISRDGDTQLSDFGIARIIEGSMQLTSDGVMIGTPFYMAPEQVQGQPSDARTDIYALGVVLYEAVTGQRPYEAETPLAVALMHLHNPLPPPRQIKPNLPETLERIILRAMAKNPADRFQNADDMAEALRATLIPSAQRIETKPLSNATVALPAIDTTIEAQQSAATPVPIAAVQASTRSARPGWLIPALIVGVVIITIAGFGALLGPRVRALRDRVADSKATATSVPIAQAAETPVSAPSSNTQSSAAVIGMAYAGNYMWTATSDGLVRWDGTNSQVFNTTNGMPFNDTRKILAAPDGTLWVAGYTDLVHIAPAETSVQLIKYFTPTDLKIDAVSAFLLENDGTIIVGGYFPSGLAYYDGTEWQRLPPPVPLEGLGELSSDISSIVRSKDGVLWVATTIGLFQLKEGTWDRYDKRRGIGEIPIYSLIEHNGLLLAAAADAGLLRYDSEKDIWVRIPIEGESPITAISALSDGTLWVGSRDFVARSSDNGATWTKTGSTADGQIHSSATRIIEDANGRIWVGSEEGLTYYDGSTWVTP